MIEDTDITGNKFTVHIIHFIYGLVNSNLTKMKLWEAKEEKEEISFYNRQLVSSKHKQQVTCRFNYRIFIKSFMSVIWLSSLYNVSWYLVGMTSSQCSASCQIYLFECKAKPCRFYYRIFIRDSYVVVIFMFFQLVKKKSCRDFWLTMNLLLLNSFKFW